MLGGECSPAGAAPPSPPTCRPPRSERWRSSSAGSAATRPSARRNRESDRGRETGTRRPAEGDRVDDGYVIETRELSKRYGERILAVDRLTLRVRRGEVYGFLGPNGAGKTTTLRMLLGLIRPSAGSALVLGSPPAAPERLAWIGAQVRTLALYTFLSDRDNLRALAGHAGVPQARVDAD